METVKMLIENWYLIVAGIAIVALAVVACIKWLQKPTAEQIENIKEWLLWAVTEAERELGGGTGKLKLRMAYDMAVRCFPWATAIPFELFEEWVDEALGQMRYQLETNDKIKKYVEGETA